MNLVGRKVAGLLPQQLILLLRIVDEKPRHLHHARQSRRQSRVNIDPNKVRDETDENALVQTFLPELRAVGHDLVEADAIGKVVTRNLYQAGREGWDTEIINTFKGLNPMHIRKIAKVFSR